MKKKDIGTYYCTITIDVFRTAVLVLVATSMEDILKDLPNIYSDINPKLDATDDIEEIRRIYREDGYMPPGHTIRLGNDSGDVIIIFKESSVAKISEETIVHETHHASHYVCSFRGIEDEETETYVQEYLFNQMMCKIDEWNANHKK